MAFKTILLKAHPEPNLEEFVANAALSPGHVCEIISTGKIQKHGTSGGKVYALVALENSLAGKTVSDAYASAEKVYCVWLKPGDQFLGRIADGENVAIGDYLESNGDGTLKKIVADTSAATIKVGSLQFVARVACDMSGSAGVDPSPLIPVQVI